MIDSWFNVYTDDSVSKWLYDNGYKAFLTETNILYGDNNLIDSSNTYWTNYFKPAMQYIIGSEVWNGVCAWTSFFDYNNAPINGNILNGPAPDEAKWTTGFYSTAPWFAYDNCDSSFNYRINYVSSATTNGPAEYEVEAEAEAECEPEAECE